MQLNGMSTKYSRKCSLSKSRNLTLYSLLLGIVLLLLCSHFYGFTIETVDFLKTGRIIVINSFCLMFVLSTRKISPPQGKRLLEEILSAPLPVSL